MSILELHNVVKRYADADESVQAADGVTLTLEQGEVLALYGPSGSGKTTLLLIAAGLVTPDSGSVRFDGQDLSSKSSSELDEYRCHDVGIIYQASHLLAGVPAVENAAVKLLADNVPLADARQAAAAWLKRFGLGSKLSSAPDKMSGGERQRVAIARALVGEPRLILADEPTGSLDSRRGLEILTLLAEIARERGAAVLLVTHDPQATSVADRVLWLRDGRLHDDEPQALLGVQEVG